VTQERTGCNHALACYDADPTMLPSGDVRCLFRCLLCDKTFDRRGYWEKFEKILRARWRIPASKWKAGALSFKDNLP